MIGKEIMNYRIVKTLGEGGMGAVYLAVHKHIPTLHSAIKVLHPASTINPSIVTKFQREAVVLSQLNHPNIVRLLDFTQKGQQFYLIMEYVDGQSLAQVIKESGPMKEERVIPILNKILDAFQYAHDQTPPIIHRDIKPSNIIIGNKDEPKVIDFGIVKILESDGQPGTTSAGTVMGTLPYMSPEQVKGKDVDSRTDIYALGITLFYMVTGRLPFPPGLSEYELQACIVNNQVCQAKQVNPQVSAHLNTVIAQATANDKKNRFSSCAAFKAALNKKTLTQNKKATAANKPAGVQGIKTVVLDKGAEAETKDNNLIHFFYANKTAVKKGEEVILTWNTTADKKIVLAPMGVEVKPVGTYSHRPDGTVTYRLSAGEEFKEVTVAVNTENTFSSIKKIGPWIGAVLIVLLVISLLSQKKDTTTPYPQEDTVQSGQQITSLPPVEINAIQEDLIYNKIKRFYQTENNKDPNGLMTFFHFPVERFGELTFVSREALFNIYNDWFIKNPNHLRTVDWSNWKLSVYNDNQYMAVVPTTLVVHPGTQEEQRSKFSVTLLLNRMYHIVYYREDNITSIYE